MNAQPVCLSLALLAWLVALPLSGITGSIPAWPHALFWTAVFCVCLLVRAKRRRLSLPVELALSAAALLPLAAMHLSRKSLGDPAALTLFNLLALLVALPLDAYLNREEDL